MGTPRPGQSFVAKARRLSCIQAVKDLFGAPFPGMVFSDKDSRTLYGQTDLRPGAVSI